MSEHPVDENTTTELIAEARVAVKRGETGGTEGWDLVGRLAAALEAAQPRVVRTVEELDALPHESIVKNEYGYAWQRRWSNWYCVGATGGRRAVPYLPALVLWVPVQEGN